MSHTLAIATWNNEHQLVDTLVSLARNTDFSGRVIVINNGKPGIAETIQWAVPYDISLWIDAGKNLGWEGAINLALSETDTDLFTMLNDDVLFPPASTQFWDRTLRWFDKTDVGGVGPTSNYVAGWQNAFRHQGQPVLVVPYLIGFCATYRTKLLKDLGGLDASLPGGDDLDLSIRVSDAGFKLVADRRNFLFHHGAQTGQRVHPGQWDSHQHQADTYNALIKKHGLKRWFECVNGIANDSPSLFLPDQSCRATRRAMESCGDNIAGLYAKSRTEPSDVNEHLDILLRYASSCDVVVETGVEDGTTTAAFLQAAPRELHSFDIKRHPNVTRLEDLAKAEGQHFEFHEGDILKVDIPACDMWYVDDYHTYAHVKAELSRHSWKVRKYIFLHDTEMFYERGEDGTVPGIWTAIAEFLREHPQWRICYHTDKLNGLTGLVRQ